MGKQAKQGRWIAEIEGDFVVFLIGARPQWSHPIRTLKDLGGMRGMVYMLKYLSERPDKGLLGYESLGFGTFVVQYWRSFEQLEAFAREDADPHRPAWRRYYQRVAKDPRSGVWHETYLVRDGQYEAIYVNMPPYGLGRAVSLVPASESSRSRTRIRSTA